MRATLNLNQNKHLITRTKSLLSATAFFALLFLLQVFSLLFIIHKSSAETLSIEGKVTISEAGLPGVSVTLRANDNLQALTREVLTDSTGHFSFDSISPSASSYTLTPSKDGYLFSPAFVTVNSSSTATIQLFSARPDPSKIFLLSNNSCISQRPDGTFLAVFKYRNLTDTNLFVPHSQFNQLVFTADSGLQSQPEILLPSASASVTVAIPFSGLGASWTLGNTTANVSQNSPRCSNLPPVCNAGGQYQVNCEGYFTRVFLLGVNSFDPDFNLLSFRWESTCLDSTMYNGTTSSPTLYLARPGRGETQECSVTLTVSDGVETSQCSAQITALPCQLDCAGVPFGDTQIDQCGVCGGNNACLDCEGIPFGPKRVDKCGICGGNNACLDCEGIPFGTKKLDQCGVCGGDNSTCLSGCVTQDIEDVINPINRTLLTLRDIYGRALRRYREVAEAAKVSNIDKIREQVTKRLKRISFRYPKKFNLNFSLLTKTTVLTCSEQVTVCSVEDRIDAISSLEALVASWEKNTIKVVKRALKLGAARSESRKRIRRAKRLKAIFLQFLNSVPRFNSNCQGGTTPPL